MAENESLDLGKSHRWLKVFRAVEKGEHLETVVALLVDSLYRTLRRVQKQIPLAQLLVAAGTQAQTVNDLVKQCKGHDFARLFSETLEPGASREATAQNFIQAILEKVSDQIVCRLVPSGRWPQMHEIVGFMYDVGRAVMPEVERIAERWSDDPHWTPRALPTATQPNVPDKTEALLEESILGLRQ
jgi:hypothetical protein